MNWEASARDGGTPGAINTASTVGGNRLPEAAFTASPASGEAPLEVLLDATRSYDLDGSIVRYGWDFDDGATDAGAVVSHTFQTAGVYAVRLEVEDDEGAVDSSTRLISVDVDPGGNQIAGDTNQDGVLDISDAISLLQILFTGGRSPPCGGNDIGGGGNRALLDVNSDNGVDISDGIFLLAYLFTGGPAPAQGRDCTPIPGCADVCAP
ncbi:MAG: PKD domain-containing protein [Planctomycetota bacterium]|nr:PKD domain-containing protein [Planctomycetota bacterium]